MKVEGSPTFQKFALHPFVLTYISTCFYYPKEIRRGISFLQKKKKTKSENGIQHWFCRECLQRQQASQQGEGHLQVLSWGNLTQIQLQ